MAQDKVMQFDPYSCTLRPWPSHAGQYRETWPHRTWYFDPWKGTPRNEGEIKADPKGFGIEQP